MVTENRATPLLVWSRPSLVQLTAGPEARNATQGYDYDGAFTAEGAPLFSPA